MENRVIKFRAFGKRSNRMHYWSLNDAQSDWISPDEQISEVMQFTGLLDKKGKEIYEGDIVTEGKSNTKFEVEWYKTGFRGLSREGDEFGPYTLSLYINDNHPKLTIIGNLFTTPELIKQESK